VSALAGDEYDVCIGGLFTNIHSYFVTDIARWNRSDFQWHALVSGVNGTVRRLIRS
jgi:hypothetical protein